MTCYFINDNRDNRDNFVTCYFINDNRDNRDNFVTICYLIHGEDCCLYCLYCRFNYALLSFLSSLLSSTILHTSAL